MAEYLRKGCGDLNEVASDNDDVKDDDDDDDDTNSKDVEVVEIGIGETLTMLDRLVNLKNLSKEERNFLVAMKFKLERIRELTKKQSYIISFLSMVTTMSSTYIYCLKYRYKSSKLLKIRLIFTNF